MYAVLHRQVYYLAGETGVASALLATVIVSMMLQICLVIFVHRHRGFRPVLLEVLIVLSGFKPLVDTRRMFTGHEIAGAAVSLNNERTGCKMVEMVIEAVPSVVIVFRNTLASGVTSYVPLCSILVSLLTIATTSTGIFFGFDLDSSSRQHSPMFYGCIRDNPRRQALTRVALYLLCLAHATAKLFTISMLLVLSKVALAVHLTVMMVFFFAVKLRRNDVYYWAPKSGFKVALIMRLMAKIFVDVTANPHFRPAPHWRARLGRTVPAGVRLHGLVLQAPLRAWRRRLVGDDCRDPILVHRDLHRLLTALRWREHANRSHGVRRPRCGFCRMDCRAGHVSA